MATLIASCLVLISLSPLARAGQNTLCEKTLPCGTYEGSGSWYDSQGKQTRSYEERIVISPVNSKTLRVEVSFIEGSKTRKWGDVQLTFERGGAFRYLDKRGQSYASGHCNRMVCNVAFAPVAVHEGEKEFVNSFVNTLRFEGNKLRRFNMVSNGMADEDLKFQRSELTKK